MASSSVVNGVMVNYGAKNFFSKNSHGGCHIVKNCGLNKISFKKFFTLWTLSTAKKCCPLFFPMAM